MTMSMISSTCGGGDDFPQEEDLYGGIQSYAANLNPLLLFSEPNIRGGVLLVRATVRVGCLGSCQVESPSIHLPQGRPLGQRCLPQGFLSFLSLFLISNSGRRPTQYQWS